MVIIHLDLIEDGNVTMEFINKYKHELCLKEYKNCIERNNSFNTKISILVATEAIVLCNYFSIFMGSIVAKSNCNLKVLIIIGCIIVVAAIFLQLYILYMRGEYNLLNCGIFNPNEKVCDDENEIIKIIISDIKTILEDRNNNYQKKTIIFNLSIIFLLYL